MYFCGSLQFYVFYMIQANLSALQSEGLAIDYCTIFFFNRYKPTISEISSVWRILYRISLKPSASLLCANINTYTGSRCVSICCFCINCWSFACQQRADEALQFPASFNRLNESVL